jgi:hypothetical protein
MAKRLNLIIPDKPVFLISPHFDDAVFSAGFLITQIKQHQPVRVVNVFTSATKKPATLSAKAFLRQCGSSDAVGLYSQRLQEDNKVLTGLKINPINMGFTEAMWRSKNNIFGKVLPELGAVYPTYRWHIISGRISAKDHNLMEQIYISLKKIIPRSATVICPIGIGNHVDHLIVRDVCSQLPNKIIYWSDFPYDLKNTPDPQFITKHGLKPFEFPVDSKSKLRLMQGYISQFPAVFPKGLTVLPPEYYYEK